MKRFAQIFFGFIIISFFSETAFAVQVSWTDWISSDDSFSASGVLLVEETTTVNVEYVGTGSHLFVQTGTGVDYWDRGSPYTNGVVNNDPTASEMVALHFGGTVTITFSETIKDPFIGLVSWNHNTVDFGVPVVIDSFGPGHWGDGTPILNATGTGFFGSSEVHGVISLPGSFDSITFTHTLEGWHGFTVGVAGLASPVPIPATVWLFGSCLIGLIGIKKKSSKISKLSA